MEKVFVYGTLKQGFPNENVLHAPECKYRYLGSAVTLESYPMILNGIEPWPYLLNLPQAGAGSIAGEVIEVNGALKAILDDYEEVPTMYYRGSIEVQLLQEVVTCQVYFATLIPPKWEALSVIQQFTLPMALNLNLTLNLQAS